MRVLDEMERGKRANLAIFAINGKKAGVILPNFGAQIPAGGPRAYAKNHECTLRQLKNLSARGFDDVVGRILYQLGNIVI